ncbi:hypothetical protein C4D60_Mb04t35750 [Musa balbisiana]|uniref:Uncharacterized protein n=1 Tax=Musa balbisiana TaxID=52838 RepID=A0A4S8KH17_MUSBA|nr:hypothetical protein C4D60_Mb04t35750 [Musa balbisiana]
MLPSMLARSSTQPPWQCQTPPEVPSYPYKQPHQSSKRTWGETTEEHLQNHPLHIANLIVGGVGPSPRPDLCAGARRCRLSLALRRSFLPTRTTVLGQPACVVLLGCMPPRDHTCAASPPASCSSTACLPETTPARPARLRRAPRLHASPRPHLRGQPACVVLFP